jgi:AraC-like DNA-binding protein
MPERERRTALCELAERGVLPIEPLPQAAACLQITKWFLPGAGIFSGTLSGLRQVANRGAPESSDELLFGINLAGQSVASQRGRQVAFGHGEAVVLDCAEGNFSIDRPTPAQFIGIRVPRRAIAPLLHGRDDRRMRVLPRQTDALVLLTSYVRALAGSKVLAGSDLSHAVAHHLHDLIALSIGAHRDGAATALTSVRAARLQAIKSDLVANCSDPSLTLAQIAARHGVTPRYVHKLFELEESTYTQFVLRLRLERAYRMLRDERFAARSITAIAYDAGFADLSYLNRAFRRHYDARPSDIRMPARLADTPVASGT